MLEDNLFTNNDGEPRGGTNLERRGHGGQRRHARRDALGPRHGSFVPPSSASYPTRSSLPPSAVAPH